ncbi:MAG: phosphoribosylamine--glycine ligase [Phycisphaerae bacterium]|nr:phosphoribosylamine--glycine ligase [Phycisphaerae bacterium]
MKVLVVGSGGREHVLAERLAQSDHVGQVFCAPGNGGTTAIAENVPIEPHCQADLLKFAREQSIDLTVVGPEAPLCAGIVDQFQAANLPIFGPTQAAARIEGDKAYAKQLMLQSLIPTAKSRIFTRHEDAREYVATRDTAQVVKAAGLAGGKGSIVCDDPADALLALERIMVDKQFGDAGNTVVVEEKLTGPELSVFAVVDGHTLYVLEPAQDHKPVGESTTGPNTGGMGAHSPAPIATEKILRRIDSDILIPIISALEHDGAAYRGLLYAGLILTAAGPKVLEFNCRFGDPEAQVILPRLRSDLFELLHSAVHGKLDQIELQWDRRSAVCVVMASEGYPGAYETGKEVHGVDAAESLADVRVYHAGTKWISERLITTGGRVLGVTTLADSLAGARERCYDAIERISFEGAFYRRDIAAAALP